MKKLLSIVAAVFVFSYSQVVWSQSPSPGAGWVPGIVQGNTVWFGPANATKGSATMGQAIWQSATAGAGGGATVTTTAKLAVGAGQASVVAKGAVTGVSVFTAFKAIAGGPVSVGLTALMVVPAIIDWLADSGVRPSSSGSPLPFERRDPSLCTIGPCYEYSPDQLGGWYSSKSKACDAVAAWWFGAGAGATGSVSSSGTYCTTNPPGPEKSLFSRVVPSSPDNWMPSSMDDIAPYMSNRSASAAAIQAMLDAGASIKITSPSVTGPLSVTAPDTKNITVVPSSSSSSSSTVSGNPHGLPDGVPTVTANSTSSRDVSANGSPVSIPSNTTTTSTYNASTNKTTSQSSTTSAPHTVTTTSTPVSTVTYSTGPNPQGDTVPKVTSSTVTNSVTNVTNNITNETTTTTSQDSKPDSSPPEKEDYSFNDSPFGDVPELYKRKYENGIEGVWDEKMIAIKSTPLFTLGRDIMPTLAATGSCPVFTVPLDLAGWASYGTADVSPPCWVWDFGKVVIVISSLLLARRLIFGG